MVIDRLSALLQAYALKFLIGEQRRVRRPGHRLLEDILLDFPVEKITIESDTNPEAQTGNREVLGLVQVKRPTPGEPRVFGVKLRWEHARGRVIEEEVFEAHG